MKHALVTGAAGFIGFHLSKRLLREGYKVTGFDNVNDYYDVTLKYGRMKELGVDHEHLDEQDPDSAFQFVKGELSDRKDMESLFGGNDFDVVVNLAAQAGVRYSLENPHAYIESNIDGFLNILEGCRYGGVEHLVYASSSSVYGSNKEMPFKTSDRVDNPVSLYAATKKSNELMAHTYSHLYDIPATGLRFFTVYGPWGRPDMALFIFTKAIVEGRPIQVFNYGEMQRDFTYIDDIVESITRLIPKAPESDNGAPHNLFNIGHNSPVKLMDFIQEIEKNLGKEADKQMMPIQPGDVPATWADVTDLYDMIDYKPKVGMEEGVKAFIDWYKGYYGV
ncbi:NAD-dependent epimerase [Rhodohalobacter mucosus]|uniref:Capsular biosynthesis protein CpsI n=1 Tax=Rhodohalobacter mucosus TaxID=2079485 RepID=A0A316TS48_9BACT|nr:NAD-dependent epimerase [Rhodohalobacter mucosus]PWN07453.1 capsular biosynthesis protein CpsI [Rhodohalobacter mucosus]